MRSNVHNLNCFSQLLQEDRSMTGRRVERILNSERRAVPCRVASRTASSNDGHDLMP